MQSNLQLALQHGLTADEYSKIISILKREPTYTELGIYSVMWSEHCSYKSSIEELKKLPREGSCLLVKAGEENAGLVDIGEGLAIAFKIESHNHPSAVEPYQGAATGVGGIMRDIFTMGARPIAALNSLRFGSIENPRTIFFMKGIVKGIGDYGNSFGVPTVAGDLFFDPSFNDNPIVNAMAVGIVKHEDIAKAKASGASNLVMIVGSSTGRDGIHGATFASEELSEASEARRPSVQVGDPFTEKLLLEASLEVIRQKLIVGIQDMGAAGLTCSTAEMSARGNVGMDIDLDKVPLREKFMTPYEIMLSESQERMLLVVEPVHADAVRNIFKKWDLSCEIIGKVMSDGMLRIRKSGVLYAEIPAESLVLGGGAPVYHLNSRRPAYLHTSESKDQDPVEPSDYNKTFLAMMSLPNICSKEWVTRQYDSTVRSNTVEIAGDAAIIRLKGTRKGIAVKTDCNSRYVYLDPYGGAQIAVAECARNIVSTGAEPLAITNCLNFGNPNDPEIFWQFSEAIRGIGDACRYFNTPVTGGNVSFYNESPSGSVYPSPVIGMLGIIHDIANIMTVNFKHIGDYILLLGSTSGNLCASEYKTSLCQTQPYKIPSIDLAFEKKIHSLILELIGKKLIHSAHDLSDGGLGVALAECCLMSGIGQERLGARLDYKGMLRLDKFLFCEDQGRFLVSINRSDLPNVESLCKIYNIECSVIGEVIKSRIMIGDVINLNLTDLVDSYNRGLKMANG